MARVGREFITKVAVHIINNKATVRDTAKCFGVSKSKVHRDMVTLLPELDRDLALKVQEVLDHHTSVRHERGGQATKLKFNKQFVRTN